MSILAIESGLVAAPGDTLMMLSPISGRWSCDTAVLVAVPISPEVYIPASSVRDAEHAVAEGAAVLQHAPVELVTVVG